MAVQIMIQKVRFVHLCDSGNPDTYTRHSWLTNGLGRGGGGCIQDEVGGGGL
jgi:hypothetical protein